MRSAFCQLCLLIFLSAIPLFAQTLATNKASVQGRVLIENAPQAGVMVVLSPVPEGAADMFTATPAPTAVTDGEGRYRFAQVAAGKYQVMVHAPVYVADNRDPLTVHEGDNIENHDFNLKRGGVITGKVLDADGQPRIEEFVEIKRVDGESKQIPSFINHNQPTTDDRGVFRLFGLAPGKYRLSAGRAEQFASIFNSAAEYERTFYPSTTEESEAKLVEIRAGAETEGIDIVLVRAKADDKKGFTVSGRIINAETNQPVAGSMVMLMPSGEAAREAAEPTMPATTDGKGEFTFARVAPGDYTATLFNVQAMMTGSASGYADPLKVTVAQADIRGLEIKLKTGASLNGVVALNAKAAAAGESPLANLMIVAIPQTDTATDAGVHVAVSVTAGAGAILGDGMALVKPDQTFALSGLRPGKYRFTSESLTGKKLQLVRIEHNGATVPHIEISSTQPVTNVRLVFAAGTGAIRRRVQVQGVTLPAGTTFSIVVERQGAGSAEDRTNFTQSDARGSFILDGLMPGSYELKVTAVRTPNEVALQYEFPAQSVALTDNASQDVVLYVNVKKENQ